jgi:hypothetical protein
MWISCQSRRCERRTSCEIVIEHCREMTIMWVFLSFESESFHALISWSVLSRGKAFYRDDGSHYIICTPLVSPQYHYPIILLTGTISLFHQSWGMRLSRKDDRWPSDDLWIREGSCLFEDTVLRFLSRNPDSL